MSENELLNTIRECEEFWGRHRYLIPDSLTSLAIRFLSTSSPEFRSTHSKQHLTKILAAFARFEYKIQEEKRNFPHRRALRCRLLKTVAQGSNTIGILIVLHLQHYSEFLTQEHVLRAINRILSGVKSNGKASYSYRDIPNEISYIYLEIDKTRGRGFSPLEEAQLQKNLVKELHESIESLSPSLFLVRNEEEIFRTIIQISREIITIQDIPQVSISFQEQTGNGFLKFSVVIVRAQKEGALPLKSFTSQLPRTVRFVPEMISNLGTLKKPYFKEANVFSLEVEGSLFIRKNSSIDLRAAREYVSKALGLMIREYRDYNGGLYLKQNEQLKEIKQILGEHENNNKVLMESLFYSFSPTLFQTFILPEAGKGCTSLFLKAIETPLSGNLPFILLKDEQKKYSLVVIKSSHEEVSHFLTKEVANFPYSPSRFGYVTQYIDGMYYIGLLYQYPSDPNWFAATEEKLLQAKNFQKVEKQILRINYQEGDPLSLNPQMAIDLRCRSLQKALFEGLTRLTPDGVAEPAGAEKIEISPCGRRYLFTLRKHLWSNGEEVTASQYERTWKKAIQSVSCLRPDVFFLIKDAKNARLGLVKEEEIGIKTLDKYTLEVWLEIPAPYFLQLVSHPSFFPIFEESGEPYIFNGPFSLYSWKKDLSLLLIKNPYYWDVGNVKLDGVEISVIRDPYLAFEKFEKGELDWIGGPFSTLPISLIKKHKDRLKFSKNVGISWLYCNLQRPPLNSAKVRQALSFSLDREKICQETLIGQIPCKTILPPDISLMREEDIFPPKDPVALFDEGLKELGMTRKDLPPLHICHSHITGQKELVEEIKRQWEERFQISVLTEEQPWNTFSQNLDKRDFHIASCYRHPFFAHPIYFLNIFTEKSNMHNAAGWEGKVFQEYMQRAKTASHPLHYLKKAEEELLAHMPVIPTHAVQYQHLTKENVSKISLSLSGDADFKWMNLHNTEVST
ncbi:MAG: Oligopeptide-binding protein OppA [Chlamydiae bacterium]|nr:Oligopeptide-binding protein OppA [Chlamydiota bacterium]